MITKERALWIYEKMLEIRSFEETAWTLFCENKIHGSVHLYLGEEAVAASVCSYMTDEDCITSTHRGHGHCIAKGGELGKTLAELMGKDTGYCRGRSGSMHIADFSKGNLGANAIVGGGIPMAVGAALTMKNEGQEGQLCCVFLRRRRLQPGHRSREHESGRRLETANHLLRGKQRLCHQPASGG